MPGKLGRRSTSRSQFSPLFSTPAGGEHEDVQRKQTVHYASPKTCLTVPQAFGLKWPPDLKIPVMKLPSLNVQILIGCALGLAAGAWLAATPPAAPPVLYGAKLVVSRRPGESNVVAAHAYQGHPLRFLSSP